MKPSEALDMNREALRDLVAASPASNPRVFGSVLHGEDDEDSDLDILVDAGPDAGLFELGGLEVDLSERLGVQVDLRTPDELPLDIRDGVVAEAMPV